MNADEKSAKDAARAEPKATEAKPIATPLGNLRAFFESMQKSRLLRRDYSTPKRKRDPKWARKRLASKEAWAAAQRESVADVAACPRCPAWFPTTAERNRHRASTCRKRPGVAP